MSLNKTLLTLTALRDGLKILWRLGAFWSQKIGKPSIDEENVDAVPVGFHSSPRKSIRVASNKLAIPRSTVHRVLHKRLGLHAYKLFKLLSRMMALAEQLLLKKFFSALMMIMAILNVWFSQTKHLLMSPEKSISITFEYEDHKILMRL